MSNSGESIQPNKRRFPSYRQWKAWRSMIPSKAGICFICHRALGIFDGLATKRVIGGKAAAFGGSGMEKIGFNKPDDRIKAGCTVKFKVVESETIIPQQVVKLASGNTFTLPEKVERVYKDKLMTVSVFGIGCELCRTLAMISERGYVDISNLVSLMDPDDAPVQGTVQFKGNAKQRALHGPVMLGVDNILRVKDPVEAAPLVTYVASENKALAATPKVSKPKDPLADMLKVLKSTQDSLLYWTSGKRKVGTVQSVEFIANQAYEAARETARIQRYIHGLDIAHSEPSAMYTPVSLMVTQ